MTPRPATPSRSCCRPTRAGWSCRTRPSRPAAPAQAIDGARRHLDRPERLAPDGTRGPTAGRRPRGRHGARHQRRQLGPAGAWRGARPRAASTRCCATARSARPPPPSSASRRWWPPPSATSSCACPASRPSTVTLGNERRLEPITQVQFSQLSLVDQLFHTVASPAVAYLLFAVGMALLIFDLFTAGVGVAGVVGAVLVHPGLLRPRRAADRTAGRSPCWSLAMIAFAVDVQTGVPRFWTAAGGVLFVIGSLFLYDGLSLSWITLGVAFVGVALTFLMAMPAMVRTRFSTPDHRTRVDDRRDGPRRHRHLTPTAPSRSARRCGGPTRTGPPRSASSTGCAWSASRASCSRSSPRRAPARDYRDARSAADADGRDRSRSGGAARGRPLRSRQAERHDGSR